MAALSIPITTFERFRMNPLTRLLPHTGKEGIAPVYICAYNSSMSYEWDPKKAKSNYKKHGVKFSDAVGVFEDENAVTIEDEHESEDRFITLGRDFLRRILIVVYTFRGVIIRLISARKTTALEKAEYEAQEENEE
jgi:uncharacterized DUF497 family protein